MQWMFDHFLVGLFDGRNPCAKTLNTLDGVGERVKFTIGL